MMDGESINIKQVRLQRMKELFPELFAEGQLDWEKLKAAFGDDINFANERYVLNWAGKSDAFKILQQPTTATLKPAPDESVNFDTTEHLFIEGENLEVLKALQKAYYGKVKCIEIDPPYNTGSDSFIYPDKFSEKKEDYLKRIGDKDEEGFLMKEGLFRKNSKDSGHYHSNWLSMMYPRLFLAKNLLRDDGVIFVHIDDNEVHNLRMVMNEIFGEENFVAQIVWQKKTGAGAKTKGFITLHEYVLCYAKHFNQDWDIEIPYSDKTRAMYNKKDEHFEKLGPYATWPLDTTSMDERRNLRFPIHYKGKDIWPKKQWLWSKDKAENAQKENKLVFNYNEKEDTYSVRFKGYLYSEDGSERRGKPLSVFVGPYTQEGTKDFESIFDARDIFPFPKPISLVKQLINVFISGKSISEDIFIDFFGGSGSTAQAVLELNKEDGGNRKFILVQMPEPCDENSEAYKSGYKTIADIGKERIRRVIKKIEKEKAEKPDLFAQGKLDLGFKVFKLSSSNFKIWRGAEIDSEEKLVQQLDAFTEPIKPGAEKQNMLYELMLKAGYELTSSVRYVIAGSFPVIASEAKQSHSSKQQIASSQTPRNDNKSNNSTGYYSINNNELIIALDALNEKLIKQIIAAKPQKVITLDSLFTGNDQLKTNTVLQMRDAGVDFKTI